MSTAAERMRRHRDRKRRGIVAVVPVEIDASTRDILETEGIVDAARGDLAKAVSAVVQVAVADLDSLTD